MSDLLSSLQFKHTRDDPYGHVEETGDPEAAHHVLTAYHAGREVGGLTWYPHGQLDSVGVNQSFQRKGVATELLHRAEAIHGGTIYHSDSLTNEGEAWANATGRGKTR